MKIQELLQETPLPPDWDAGAVKSDKSFASRVRYAQERAKKIGAGSSRIAFEIEYEGRPTILKLAKNKKGIAQNEFEASMLSDWYATDLGIFIPMIDYDEANESPTWLHVEKAEKMKPNQFKKFFNGIAPGELMMVVRYGCGQIRLGDENKEAQARELIKNNETIDSLVDLIGSYGNVPWQDFTRLTNWGVYKNEPVIIDIGLSTEVMKLHYS